MTTDTNGILITDATGFLGAYLLKELMERTQSPLYCLARSSENQSGMERLRDNLEFHFGAANVDS